tara:strand:+ start:15243 stop:15914 length:672 start_codon:yes stop_codon:yes gene_type:complete
MTFNAKTATGGQGGAAQETVAIGNYPARLVQLVDLGLQAQMAWEGEPKPPIEMVRTVYELPTEFCVDSDGNEDKEKPRWLGEEMNFYNLNAERAKSTLRYRALDPTEDCEGDWSQLIGQACTLTVVHKPNKKKPGHFYANIGSTAPPMKGFDVPPLVNPTLVWTLDDPDMEVFEKFPDFMKEKIKANLNFKGSLLEARLNGTEEADAPTETQGGEDAGENPYG